MSGSCPPFWINAPQILWENAGDFFPFTEFDKRCTSSALNSFTRFGIYLGILLAAVRMELGWLIVGILFAGFAAAAWLYMGTNGAVREGFSTPSFSLTDAEFVDGRDVDGSYVPDIIGEQGRTEPTAANPFMNVLLTEISDNPYRKPAANVQGIRTKAALDDYFQTMFASDPGDVFQKTQNQRTWITMPSTSIPNDRESLQNWLYRVPGQTCKEGNQTACTYFATGAEQYPWRSIQTLT
jgi:hypothetical protein